MCLGAIVCLQEIWDSGGMTMGRGDETNGDVVNLAYVPDVEAGDHVLVHLGFALEVLDPDTAAQAIAERRRMSEGGLSSDAGA